LLHHKAPLTLSYKRLFTFPVSTTYFMPGMVNEVSATFVAMTHSLQRLLQVSHKQWRVVN